MSVVKRILLLAGSAEARQIAVALNVQGIAVHALMSERPRGPNPMPVPFEVCTDMTLADVQQALRGSDALVDASHGFDDASTQLGVMAAQKAGVPCISFARPEWPVEGELHWQSAENVTAAMPLIPKGARVFSATGWASLPQYADFPGVQLMLRQTSQHDRPVPFDFVETVFGEPPFDVAQERALFEKLNIDTLIARNLGGAPSRPKLDAALELDLQVILIDRPPMPRGAHVVHDVDDVLTWVVGL